MEGVQRSSCKPMPPQMSVLLVSMMTTVESRKPMLLIVVSVVDGHAGLGLGTVG